jgi:hypothetical protein
VVEIQPKQVLLYVGGLMAICLWGGPAAAGIVGTTGQVDVLSSPPASLKPGHLQSNSHVFAFTEQTDLTLSTAVKVDITTPGTYETDNSLTPGTINAGTAVESYFLHADPRNNDTMFDGSVTFSTPILGVMVLSATLSASDAQLGATGTVYDTDDSGRGLELTTGQDYVTLSSNLETLTFHFFTHANLDEVRILTAVPEPSSLILAGCGVVVLAFAAASRTRGCRAHR